MDGFVEQILQDWTFTDEFCLKSFSIFGKPT